MGGTKGWRVEASKRAREGERGGTGWQASWQVERRVVDGAGFSVSVCVCGLKKGWNWGKGLG